MARTLAEFANSLTGTPEFSPKAWYNPDGDCVQYYFDNSESYRDRIDDKLTLYRSLETDRIVGCQIKGIRAMVRRLGDVPLTQKELPLGVLVMMSHFEGDSSPYEPKKRRKFYDALLSRMGVSEVTLPLVSADSPVAREAATA